MVSNGIILLGGTGSRLFPATDAGGSNKHLLYLHKQLVVDYSLTTLKSIGCKNVCCVLGGEHFSQVMAYLKDGSRYGMQFNYVFQSEPKGIAHAINLCRRFVQDEEHFVVMLGDNYFEKSVIFDPEYPGTAQIVLHKHPDLTRFGVAAVRNKRIATIVEKPKTLDCMADNYAIAGCYLFDQTYFDYFKTLKPSDRNEFEIVDVLRQYHADNALSFVFTDGVWSDLGTHQSLIEIQHHLYEKEKSNGTQESKPNHRLAHTIE
jgi:glucose-1-phosphate thymidylyltransferase